MVDEKKPPVEGEQEPSNYYLDESTGIYRRKWYKETWFTRIALVPILFLMGGLAGAFLVIEASHGYVILLRSRGLFGGVVLAFLVGGVLAVWGYASDSVKKIFKIKPRQDQKKIVYRGDRSGFEKWRSRKK